MSSSERAVGKCSSERLTFNKSQQVLSPALTSAWGPFLHARALLWKHLFQVSTLKLTKKYLSFEDTRAESFTLDVNLSLWRRQPFWTSQLCQVMQYWGYFPCPSLVDTWQPLSGAGAFTKIRLTNHSSDRGVCSLWSFCIPDLHTTEQLLQREAW